MGSTEVSVVSPETAAVNNYSPTFVLEILGEFTSELTDDVRTKIGTITLRCSIDDCEQPLEQITLRRERALSSLASLIDAHVERHWDEHHRVMVPGPRT